MTQNVHNPLLGCKSPVEKHVQKFTKKIRILISVEIRRTLTYQKRHIHVLEAYSI